jgi:lipopolysaccharide transport system ATP-binding protein
VQRVVDWIELVDGDGTPATKFQTGREVRVRIGYSNVNVPHPYFAILLSDELGNRMAYLHSTHTGESLPASGSGVVECRIPDIRLPEGRYVVMVDYGNCTGKGVTQLSMDCVPGAISFDVSLDGYLDGFGLTTGQGYAQRTSWEVR